MRDLGGDVEVDDETDAEEGGNEVGVGKLGVEVEAEVVIVIHFLVPQQHKFPALVL